MKHFFILTVFFLFAKLGMAQTTTTTTTTIPQFNSTQEKEAWIKAHPAEYQQMLNASSANAQTPTTAVSQPVVDPTFPKYVNTGNKEKDDADYKAAKEAWIKANPAKYAQMTGQPK